MSHLFLRHLLFIRQSLRRCSKAFTLVELLIVSMIAGTLAAIALPTYTNYMDKTRNSQAIVDIAEIESRIVAFQVENQAPPNTLAQVGLAGRLDPWGTPYQYLRIQGIDPLPPDVRKDKFLKPINTDFDLYSMGKNRQSQKNLTASKSRDDIIRANNGAYVGLASQF
jgi:general secretion pathway protein G